MRYNVTARDIEEEDEQSHKVDGLILYETGIIIEFAEECQISVDALYSHSTAAAKRERNVCLCLKWMTEMLGYEWKKSDDLFC